MNGVSLRPLPSVKDLGITFEPLLFLVYSTYTIANTTLEKLGFIKRYIAIIILLYNVFIRPPLEFGSTAQSTRRDAKIIREYRIISKL